MIIFLPILKLKEPWAYLENKKLSFLYQVVCKWPVSNRIGTDSENRKFMNQYVIKNPSELSPDEIETILDSWDIEEWKGMAEEAFKKKFEKIGVPSAY